MNASEEFSFEQILREMNEEGHFKASVLLSAEGLPLSSASSPFDTDTISAMVALLRNTVEQARKSIGLDEVDEVSIVQADKMRLICRCFALGDEELILSIIAPPHRTYRRLTNRAISKIRQTWKRLPSGRHQ